jgi:phytoene/squalene synthetase
MGKTLTGKELYHQVSLDCSKLTTQQYSTSFSLGIKSLNQKFHYPIYAIYGFVRFADEIVDTFLDCDKATVLARFKADTYQAIEEKLSLNPILHSFQWAVNKYQIDRELIDTFLESMEMDISEQAYDQQGYEKYILGSAEVVGLMCLRVFCENNNEQYQHLKFFAMRLGSAFQKINFLRDVKGDYQTLGRTYFPSVNLSEFTNEVKAEIEQDIEKDFADGLSGIKQLPKGCRFGVYMAYVYYYQLFAKIKQTNAQAIMQQRIRISNVYKYWLVAVSYIKHQFNWI